MNCCDIFKLISILNVTTSHVVLNKHVPIFKFQYLHTT